MTEHECSLFQTLARYLNDRKIVYRMAARAMAEKEFQEVLLWAHDLSGRKINESRRAIGIGLAAKSTLIGRLLLFIMHMVVGARRLAGLHNRNSILTFCLAMDSIVIWRYQKANKGDLSTEGSAILSRELDALKSSRQRVVEFRNLRHKGQPFAPHIKLI
jgi:hypothetical protein